MKKTLIALATALSLLMSSVNSLTSYADKPSEINLLGQNDELMQETSVDDQSYDAELELAADISGIAGDNLNWTLNASGTLYIDGDGNMTDYSSSSDVPWYSYISNIKSVIICDGVGNIGSRAFSDCSSLESVQISESVTSIGSYAFHGCSSLAGIEISRNVTNIGSYAFYGCESLESIEIPDSIKNIKSGTFRDCSSLTNVMLPDSIISIGSYAFDNCSALTSIEIPWNVTGIGSSAFSDCSSLMVISVTSFTVSFGMKVFDGCSELLILRGYSGSTTQTYADENGIIFKKIDDVMPTSAPTPAAYPDFTPEPTEIPIQHSGTDGSIVWYISNGELTITGGDTIPDYSTEGAPWYQFSDEIVKVTICDGLKTIGTNSFNGLDNVTSVSIAPSVMQINACAFEYCNSLAAIDLPAEMNGGIGINAFKGCTGLTSVNIPEGVISIGQGAFEECTAIADITLPFIGSQVGSLNNTDTFAYIFNGKVPSNLKKITITNEINVPENAFKGLVNVECITINKEVNAIGNGAFDGCISLGSFEIPVRVTELGDNTFRRCESIKTITVPDTIASIGEAVFDGCKKLTGINIPDGVKSIENYTFRGCSSLTKIEIPNSVISIGVSALEGCTRIIDVKVPFVGANSNPGTTVVTDEGTFGYLFGCPNSNIPAAVTKVEIAGTDKSNYIPKEAFKDCAYIEDIIVKGGGYILDNAFENCKNLRNLYIPKSIDNIGTTILKGCTRLETLVIPFIGINRQDQNTETSILGGFFGYNDDDKTGTMQYYDNGLHYHYYNVPTTLKNLSVLNHTVIPAGALMNCRYIENVSIVTGATMNEQAFYNCSSLKKVTMPDTLQTIGELAFAECESLESINIPTNVKTIGEQAFYNCRILKNITIPDSVTEIAENVFNGTNLCSGETELMAMKGTITCSEDSEACKYAKLKGIETNIVPSGKLNVRKTATTVARLSDNTYLFDIINAYNMNGILHVEIYSEDGNETARSVREIGNDVECMVVFTALEMVDASYAKVYITDEGGIPVSSEDEIITSGSGDIPELPQSDTEIKYSNGIINFTGIIVRPGTVLLQAIYNDDESLDRVKIYNIVNINDEIEIDTDFAPGKCKFMLWEGMDKMKPTAKSITV